MRITICTTGRFHVADLARELLALGHDVRFHSVVPPNRLEAFGLPRSVQAWHPLALPFAFLSRSRRLSKPLKTFFDHSSHRVLDTIYSRISRPGEVFIGMSGLCVRAPKAAKRRGARVLLERGSRHILSQKEILDPFSPKGKSPIPAWAVDRELTGYKSADLIVLGSRHSEQSFLDRGWSPHQLFVNPYGVNLCGFEPTTLSPEPFDVIMVGHWSMQKGCDLLSEVVLNQMGLSLLHVGSLADAPLPASKRFRHVDPVPQHRLPEFYSQARVFCMPSRQDGFGMVFSQALACGLPLVGSTRSGAEDLGTLTGLASPAIQAIPPGDASALRSAIDLSLQFSRSLKTNPRNILGTRRERLSWRRYGQTYDARIKNITGR